MRKISGILFCTVVLLFLAAVPIITLTRQTEDVSYYENRALTAAPEFRLTALADGSYFTDLESHLCDYAVWRNTALRALTWADLYLFHKPVVNDILVTDSEMLLPYYDDEVVDEATISVQAGQEGAQLEALSDTVESYGGTFLYVAVPSKYAYFEDKYPAYLNSRAEYTAASKAIFFAELDARGVNYLDIGEVWATEGNPTDYMSEGDHHYSWAGCFSTYRAVMRQLNDKFGLNLEVLSAGDLTLGTLPNRYLGSYARKLCGQWQSDEKLTYATLNEPVTFTRYNWGNQTPASATVLSLPYNDWDDVFYTVYMGGDIGETILETDRSDLPSLLIYGDSFTNPLETILYASFDEMRSIDLRYYSDMYLTDYVAEYQPDVVLCIRAYEQLVNLEGNGTVTGYAE